MILTLVTLTKVQESGVGAGLDKTSALCTVANEDEAKEVAGTSDDKHHRPEPLA